MRPRHRRVQLAAQSALVRAHSSVLARGLRSAAVGGLDQMDRALGRQDPLVPPRRLSRVGAGDFRSVGNEVLRQLVELGGLAPTDDVLDVGSGSGRVAIPLTGFISGGSYTGFDVDAQMVSWCQGAVTARFPAFTFTTLDVANSHYNRDGCVAAGGARFPYDDNAFDFALATSLFTHMLPSDFANYAREIARTLRPGATMFATFFLFDDEVLARQSSGATRIDLRHQLLETTTGIGYRAMSPRTPETAIGLDAAFVNGTLREAGLDVQAVHHGWWSGGPNPNLYQDVVIAHRSDPA